MITATNIHAHELIGLDARVVESTNASLVGFRGTVVFETKNTLTIRTKNGTKQVAKSAAKKIEFTIRPALAL